MLTAHRCLICLDNIQMTSEKNNPWREQKFGLHERTTILAELVRRLAAVAQSLVQVEAVKAPSGCFMMMSKDGLLWPSSVACVSEIEFPPVV